ncbi:MAG: AAA family ATPase [Methanobacterium sp.]
MTSRNIRKKQDNALGKGLDALIRSNYLDEEEIQEKTEETTLDVTKSSLKPENSQNLEDKAESQVNSINNLNFDDKVINDVLLDVHKNPRISLWSAKSAAVLRFLKKTKPEFSISNEASILIEEAVKDRYPDIWMIFEEKGL